MSNRKYYILIDKVPVEVTEDVYRAYKRPAWKERKRRQVRLDMELSLDLLMEDGMDIPSPTLSVDELVADRLLRDALYEALAQLSAEERNLIDILFFGGMSEREASSVLNLPRKTLAYRKGKILDKLKEILKNP